MAKSKVLFFSESHVSVDDRKDFLLFGCPHTNALKRFPDTAVRADKRFVILPAECGSAFIRLSTFGTDAGYHLIPHCFIASFFENT